jgi:hypothetical protein
MRRQLSSAALAGVVALLASPAYADRTKETETVVGAIERAIPATGLRDEAAMVLVGTALIGLAAAVRRAV